MHSYGIVEKRGSFSWIKVEGGLLGCLECVIIGGERLLLIKSSILIFH